MRKTIVLLYLYFQRLICFYAKQQHAEKPAAKIELAQTILRLTNPLFITQSSQWCCIPKFQTTNIQTIEIENEPPLTNRFEYYAFLF